MPSFAPFVKNHQTQLTSTGSAVVGCFKIECHKMALRQELDAVFSAGGWTHRRINKSIKNT
jgi:hypothetical protein